MILSVLPVMFIIRIVDVSRYGSLVLIFATIIAIIWIIAVVLTWRKLNEKIH